MSLRQPNNLSTRLCLQSFLVQCSLNLLPFLESIWFFLFCFWKHRVFDKFIKFRGCVKRVSCYFHCFNKAKLIEERDRENFSHGYAAWAISFMRIATPVLPFWMPHHNIELNNPLIFNSTTGIPNIILFINLFYLFIYFIYLFVFPSLLTLSSILHTEKLHCCCNITS